MNSDFWNWNRDHIAFQFSVHALCPNPAAHQWYEVQIYMSTQTHLHKWPKFYVNSITVASSV